MILHFSNDDPTYTIQDADSMEVDKNPWSIEFIYELQYFNCPDLNCDFKSKSKQDFVNHLHENHAESLIMLKNIKDDSLRFESSTKILF